MRLVFRQAADRKKPPADRFRNYVLGALKHLLELHDKHQHKIVEPFTLHLATLAFQQLDGKVTDEFLPTFHDMKSLNDPLNCNVRFFNVAKTRVSWWNGLAV